MADAPKSNLRRYTKKARVALKSKALDRSTTSKGMQSARGNRRNESLVGDRNLGRPFSPVVERNRQLREDLNVSGEDKVSEMRSQYSKCKPRYMDVHAWKGEGSLARHDQKAVVSKFLNVKNRLGLNYLRPEYEGMVQEKEDGKLEVQDKKNKLVME